MIRVTGPDRADEYPDATRMDVDAHMLLILRDDDGKAVAYYRDWSSVAVVDLTPAESSAEAA